VTDHLATTTQQLRSSLARSLRQQAALLSLSTLDRQPFEARVRQILRVDAQTVEVARVSFWSFREDPAAIHCDVLYLRDADRFEAGVSLAETDYPRYFEAMRRGETVGATDAHADPRTSEFSASYLGPLGIGAMLDVPVYVRGRLLGVVCHEHVGGPRAWTEDEKLFAMSIGQLVSLAIETRDREAAEEALRESEARFRHMALHDPLTGLPNRRLFFETLRREIALAQRSAAYRFGVLFIDLDGFKRVNDEHGHDAGDALLVACADRLRACLRATDAPARIGGDEFTVLLANVRDAGEVDEVAERVAAALRPPVLVGGRELYAPASVGSALGDGTVADASAVLRHADEAMYRVKQGRGGRV
jgi:diguanylate cyclase (GGDEF)-like protein